METEKQVALNTSKWLLEILKKLSFPLSECSQAMNAQVMLTNIIMGIVSEEQKAEEKID